MHRSKTILKVMPILLGIAVLSGCATNTRPAMTPLQVRSLQTHTFDTSKTVAFNAVVTVFQNLGYIIESASKSTGFITAESPSKNKTSFWDALDMVNATGKTSVTAFVTEPQSGTAKVRLDFVNSTHSSGAYGQSNDIDNKILDPKVYQNAFDKIGTAIFVAKNGQ